MLADFTSSLILIAASFLIVPLISPITVLAADKIETGSFDTFEDCL
jgi:hypothetical protein